MLLGVLQTLPFAQFGVAYDQREPDQEDGQTDARNAQQSLHVSICQYDCFSLRRSYRIRGCECERISVDFRCERGAACLAQQLAGDNVLPQSTTNCVSKRRPNVVCRKVDACDNSDVLVFGGCLDTSLRWIWEHSTRDTQTDLCAYDSGVVCFACAAAVVDQKTECYHEEAGAKNNEGFEAAHPEDDQSEDEAGDDGAEAIERGDPCRTLDTLIERHDQHGVQEITLHVPGEVQRACDTESTPDCAVGKKVEGEHRMGCTTFPDDENGDTEDANHERCNDFGCSPLRRDAACNCKGLRLSVTVHWIDLKGVSTYSENAAENCYEQDHARNIKLPEERCCETLDTINLVWSLVVVERSSLPCLIR